MNDLPFPVSLDHNSIEANSVLFQQSLDCQAKLVTLFVEVGDMRVVIVLWRTVWSVPAVPLESVGQFVMMSTSERMSWGHNNFGNCQILILLIRLQN